MSPEISYTQKEQIQELFKKQQEFAPKLALTSWKERVKKLDKILDLLESKDFQEEIYSAIGNDMSRHKTEIAGGEISVIILGIKHIKKNIRNWLKPKRVPTPTSLKGAQSYISYESKGVSLIIAPWNYPFQLVVQPLIYAIAAGCPVLVKPSEISMHSAILVEKFIKKLFTSEEVAVVQGGVEETTELLKLPFAHIHFTGSGNVGKIVMGAASKHLTSVTLELGGKSPAIIDQNINISKAADSIIWGKLFNCGQTCIGIDYLLVPENRLSEVTQALKESLFKMYGGSSEQIKENDSLARIISAKHFDRIQSLIDGAVSEGAKIEVGGTYDKADKFIAPTILTKITLDMKIMQEEIFGPVLPVLTYKTIDEAISIVRKNKHPLSSYVFSKSTKIIERIRKEVLSGALVINDVLIQYANEHLPFGGIQGSGIGKAHGTYGLYSFMNEKAVMHQKTGLLKLIHPPYSEFTTKLVNMLSKI